MDYDRQTLWQTTYRQHAQWLRSPQVRVMHKLVLIYGRNSAHDLDVKLVQEVVLDREVT